MKAPSEGTLNRETFDVLAAQPGVPFSRQTVTTTLHPDLDRDDPEWERLAKSYGQCLNAMSNRDDYPIVRVDYGQYAYDSEFQPPPPSQHPRKARASKLMAEDRWQPIEEVTIDRELVEHLVKGDVIGASRSGNWIMRDPQDRIWLVAVEVKGYLL